MGHSDYHPQMVGSLLALPHLYPIMYPLCIHYVSIIFYHIIPYRPYD